MRVTFVLPVLSRIPIGGYRVIFEYADHLAENGHRVDLVYPRRILPERLGLLRRLEDRLWPIKQRLLGRRLIRWHDLHANVHHLPVARLTRRSVPAADVIVATAWQTAGAVAALPSSKGRKFYLIQHYETWSGPKAAVDATWLLPLRKIIIAEWLREVGEGLGATSMEHITNGLDLAVFRVTRPIEIRPLRIVTMNHAEPFKGVADALAALELLHETRPSLPVAMFGTAPRGPEIPNWITYYENPEQRVLVEDVYNGSAIYLGASLVEGWGLPPAEAMACGCAFVGTDIGGFREFAIDGVNARLSPPGRPDLLARDLIELVDDREELLRLQREAEAHMREFTWDRAGAAFLSYVSSKD